MKVLLVVVMVLLTGCSVLQDKMDAINGLTCAPPVHSMCEPNESLLICDSADKRDCHGWLIE
jgi:hypothetical protein|tara:strand:+ start:1355 stop:1540 length:186 start_codon:yes stop_codon:yes gene_type:complete